MIARGYSGRKSYTNPARRGKRGLLIDVDPITYDAFKQLARELNSSVEYLGHKALVLLFKDAGASVPQPVQERLEQPAKRRRGPKPRRESNLPKKLDC